MDDLTRHRLQRALLDCDGSCRDINFAESIPTCAAVDVVRVLGTFWTLAQAMTGEGLEIQCSGLHSALREEAGALSTVWHRGRNPANIQAYFFWQEADKVFCELTFFPQDFDSGTFSPVEFLSLLSKLVRAAGSEEYYLRYEDASWRHGQLDGPGIILSDRLLLLGA